MDRSLIVSTPSRTRPQLIRSNPQHLPSFNNKCHMRISHIRFHTTRCHTHMLLNQVTHVLFVHAHFLILFLSVPLSLYPSLYKAIHLYIVLTVHMVPIVAICIAILIVARSPCSDHREGRIPWDSGDAGDAGAALQETNPRSWNRVETIRESEWGNLRLGHEEARTVREPIVGSWREGHTMDSFGRQNSSVGDGSQR